MDEQRWRDEAACVGAADRFFPENVKGPYAKRILGACQECPVRAECLQVALASPWEPYGVWGGLPVKEVRRLWHNQHPHYRTAIHEAGLPA